MFFVLDFGGNIRCRLVKRYEEGIIGRRDNLSNDLEELQNCLRQIRLIWFEEGLEVFFVFWEKLVIM